jgi:hypothetical protein
MSPAVAFDASTARLTRRSDQSLPPEFGRRGGRRLADSLSGVDPWQPRVSIDARVAAEEDTQS